MIAVIQMIDSPMSHKLVLVALLMSLPSPLPVLTTSPPRELLSLLLDPLSLPPLSLPLLLPLLLLLLLPLSATLVPTLLATATLALST